VILTDFQFNRFIKHFFIKGYSRWEKRENNNFKKLTIHHTIILEL